MIQKEEREFTKFEVARILGARALQVAMNAPLLLKIDNKKLEEIHFDSLKIAELEFNAGVLPITVKRPFPEKREGKLKREKTDEEKAKDEIKEKLEEKEEKRIKEEGEIMELVKPEDETEHAREEELEEEGEA